MSRHDALGLCRNDVQILYETRRVEIFFLTEIRRYRDGCKWCSCHSAADAKCCDLCCRKVTVPPSWQLIIKYLRVV